MTQEKTIAVIGSGTMGNGIAHVAALSGYKVFLVDIDNGLLDKAINVIAKNLQKQLEKMERVDVKMQLLVISTRTVQRPGESNENAIDPVKS